MLRGSPIAASCKIKFGLHVWFSRKSWKKFHANCEEIASAEQLYRRRPTGPVFLEDPGRLGVIYITLDAALDSTAAGRPDFRTTQWGIVAAASAEDSAEVRAALDGLYRVYCYPVYAFIRRRGYGRQDAQDLTQDFFVHLLEKAMLRRADPQRGRFRSFLLGALDHFLEKYPEYRERVVFVQIGVPSRTHIPQYKLLEDEIDGVVEEINWKWSTDSWRPIVYYKQQYSPRQMMGLHRLAQFCIVSSLDDGMNLVAKEFVASRFDEDGVLILSRFTGAARELGSAVLVNPFAVDELAEAIRQALEMPEEERRKRMEKMRQVVAENNIYRWAGKFLSTLLKFEFPENSRAESELVSQAV